jgi:hypothetical protein
MKPFRRALGLARHALVFEFNIYKSLLRWVLRRPSIPPGFEPVGYARLATPMLALWIFGSALELPLVHVLVPWHTVRLSLLILGIWGLLWMLGLLAGLRSYPHLLGSDALRIRNGALHDIAIPWEAVAQVTTQDRSLPSSMWVLQSQETEHGTHLNVAVSGRVNVHLALRDQLEVRTRKGEMVITGVSLWADDPREVAARIRRGREPGPAGVITGTSRHH